MDGDIEAVPPPNRYFPPLSGGDFEAIASGMAGYRLQYLDQSRKFIRADRIDATTDEEAVSLALLRNLSGRSELWRGSDLVAKLPRAAVPVHGRGHRDRETMRMRQR